MLSACPTPLTRVPVTRPPSLSGALEGAQNPKWLEHWGMPRQSPRWTKSSRSGMKPSPSERQMLMGAGRAVGGSPSGLCPARGEEVRSQVFLQGKPHKLSPCHKAGAVATQQCGVQAALPATCRKHALEAELDTCKAKLHAVEAQLLEVLEEKLRLKQEVEAWEEDMRQLVRQQVERQLQREAGGSLGAPVDPRTARAPWVRFLLGRWRRWW
uniref:uncharacterized protein LOC118548630 n=1 Tax=Halichoerus grypus TaxID=9711 RepID=UPI001659E720|nr:uncharacterized protein LOC118548630 [Halichoerus grypus]